jgi:hypothetical protein
VQVSSLALGAMNFGAIGRTTPRRRCWTRHCGAADRLP